MTEGQTSGYNLALVKEKNDRQMIDLIFRYGPISRNELVERLGLSKPSVTNRVSELLSRGLILEQQADIVPGQKVIGRRAQSLRINPEAGYTVGIECGPYMTGLSLCNAAGFVMDSVSYPVLDNDYELMIAQLSEYTANLLRKNRVAKKKVLGAGVVVPGYIDRENGVVRRSAVFSALTMVPFAADLQNALNLPVIVENNVKARAVREEVQESRYRSGGFLYYFISRGISCFMVMDQNMFLGNTGDAGEIGKMIVNYTYESGKPVTMENCLENFASEAAIMKAGLQAMKEGRCLLLKEMTDNAEENDSFMKQILEAQQAGDPDVCAILEKADVYHGICLANIVNFINPKMVLVDGYIMKNEENRRILRKSMNENLFGVNGEEVDMEFIPFDIFSGAKGGATIAIQEFFLNSEI